jgi:hypothetical protein
MPVLAAAVGATTADVELAGGPENASHMAFAALVLQMVNSSLPAFAGTKA